MKTPIIILIVLLTLGFVAGIYFNLPKEIITIIDISPIKLEPVIIP